MSDLTVDTIWKKVGKLSGLLTDDDIILLGENNSLITKEFDPSQVKQTCYELRVGKVAYFLSRAETERKQRIDENNSVVMRPGEVVTIITLEEISLPDFVLGRIISKGHLFSIGLSPVITYADPGFSGNLGITFINLSKKTVKLKYKEAICKIEFEKLGKTVKNPYRGPHNFASELWPIDFSKILPPRKISDKELTDDSFLRKEADLFGEPFDILMEAIIYMRSQIRTLRLTIQSLIICIVGVIIYFSASKLFDFVKILPETVQGNLIAGLIAGMFTIVGVLLESYLMKRKK